MASYLGLRFSRTYDVRARSNNQIGRIRANRARPDKSSRMGRRRGSYRQWFAFLILANVHPHLSSIVYYYGKAVEVAF